MILGLFQNGLLLLETQTVSGMILRLFQNGLLLLESQYYCLGKKWE